MPRKKSSSIDGPTFGTRKIMGTDWPLFWQVRKGPGRKWTCALVCNGVAEASETFFAKRSALAWAGLNVKHD